MTGGRWSRSDLKLNQPKRDDPRRPQERAIRSTCGGGDPPEANVRRFPSNRLGVEGGDEEVGAPVLIF